MRNVAVYRGACSACLFTSASSWDLHASFAIVRSMLITELRFIKNRLCCLTRVWALSSSIFVKPGNQPSTERNLSTTSSG